MAMHGQREEKGMRVAAERQVTRCLVAARGLAMEQSVS